jgi:acetyl esterase/lipase
VLTVILSLALASIALIAGGLAPAVHPAVSLDRNIRYGQAGGVDLLMDAYLPSGPGPFAAVLVIHGGSWNSGDKADMAVPSEGFADAGFAAFAVDYRLAPSSTYPAQLADLQTAVRFVRANAARYRVDPARVGAFGVSAGGHLASLLATVGQGATDTGARIAAAMSWSGPEDLVSIVGGARGFGLLDSFIGCSLAACPERWREASPVTHVDRSDAPLLLANSTDELVPLTQAEEMARALRRHGVPAELIEVPGTAHVVYGFVDVGGKTVTQRTLDFARRWLGSATASSPSPTPPPAEGSSAPPPATPSAAGARDGASLVVPLAVSFALALAVGVVTLLLLRSRR